jgi:hypothetical protein
MFVLEHLKQKPRGGKERQKRKKKRVSMNCGVARVRERYRINRSGYAKTSEDMNMKGWK